MTLRTKSRGMQALVWLGAACACVFLYALAVRLLGTGPAAAWYAPEQMRFFLPFAILFGLVAYETRWDGIVRKTAEEAAAALTKSAAPAQPPAAPMPTVRAETAPPVREAVTDDTQASCEAWQRAREMPHEWIPDLKKDAEYLKLVFQAADEGCVPALVKLSEYAERRGALVETYFWMALAEKHGHAAAKQQLLSIRKKWMLEGCQLEYENVYPGFPEERGSVGRALLAMACGIDVPLARQRLHDRAKQGQADACLLLGMPVPTVRADGLAEKN